MIHSTWGLIIASGKEEQLASGVDVAFLNIGSRPALAYSLGAYERCPDIEGVVVVVARERMESVKTMAQMMGFLKVRSIVSGMARRVTSTTVGLPTLPESATLVSIHQVSRPMVTPDLISETIKSAKRYGSGVAAMRLGSPVREAKGQTVDKVLNRNLIWEVLTPQTYRRDLLEKALQKASKSKKEFEEESETLDLIKEKVHLVPSSSMNIRVSTPDDLTLAAALARM